MPIISITQLLDKTFYVTKPIPFYRVQDLNEKGDKAKKVGDLKTNYFFRLDSYLQPREAGKDNYSLTYAKLSDFYFLFRGRDKVYYGVKYINDGRFSLQALKEQGVKTVEQERKEQEEKQKTPVDKITEIFQDAGSSVKKLLYIGLGIWAVGYLIQKSK